MNYHLVRKSSNLKTGPIPVSTTSAATCPDACPFKKNGCYADAGKLAIHWRKVTDGERGTDLDAFVAAIAKLPDGQLWRHNQAGDLPGHGDAIDPVALAAIVAGNAGKRGFTYTHKPMTEANAAAVADANANGFTVNLSGNNLAHADQLADLNIGPVVAVIPRNSPIRGTTPAGRTWVQCPAVTKDKVTCATCGLCQKRDRKYVIAFTAHGTGAKKAESIAKEN